MDKQVNWSCNLPFLLRLIASWTGTAYYPTVSDQGHQSTVGNSIVVVATLAPIWFCTHQTSDRNHKSKRHTLLAAPWASSDIFGESIMCATGGRLNIFAQLTFTFMLKNTNGAATWSKGSPLQKTYRARLTFKSGHTTSRSHQVHSVLLVGCTHRNSACSDTASRVQDEVILLWTLWHTISQGDLSHAWNVRHLKLSTFPL